MNKRKKKILLTNDDGIRSAGLLELYKQLSTFADVTIITPEVQKSGQSKAITINNILRVEPVNIAKNIDGYYITGTSADAIIYGLTTLEERPFDMVVAGINQGLNISSHIVLTSGTCAACFEASFAGTPAVAFSMDVSRENFFVSPSQEAFHKAADIAGKIVKQLLEMPYPEDLAFININFPKKITEQTNIEWTHLAKKLLEFKPQKKKDPRNKHYYFLWGELVKEIEEGTDLAAITSNNISCSPITNNLNFNSSDTAKKFVKTLINKL